MEGSTEKDESQKLQARTLEGSIAPQCKHVFVTGAFCAADAGTPVRSVGIKNNTPEKSQGKKGGSMWPIGQGPGIQRVKLKRKDEPETRYVSICCASMVLLKAIRRSSATAAKYAQ
jgi:hypothetical protein